ncbi:hemerythrin domain-containing protein [Phenylobacterium sp.]|uniref:hemerythrin domain-containing protein n=1 Tax=Phenylobacterium sp. TaxID=1871053 RepID=UPI00393C59D7
MPAQSVAPAQDDATWKLIAHILERYHETHRREFPEAIRLARKVEAVHAGDADRPTGLADHLALMFDDLDGHQRKEEQVLFPMMMQGGGPMIRFPITRMMAEHAEVDEQLVRLRTLTRDFTPPEGACATWRLLCLTCRKIHDDLIEHMRLENEELFAAFLG